jgi:hypothetical protein
MTRQESLASVLVDQAIVTEMMPWPCPSDFGPGGRYRLEELLAASAGGLIYRATDKKLSSEGFEAQVALKVLRDRPGAKEALASRRAVHPNALAVLDQGEHESASYIVAELVDGGDLSELALPLNPRRACELVAKIARAVQAAHSAGIVHCDLKPANVLLTKSGEPKLCDFGLSRWSSDEEGEARGNTAFMSPEQYRREENALTPPSDIYALGGLLYHLLTGKLPHGTTPDEVSRHHREGLPVPSPRVDRDLDLLCQRATAGSRAARYDSAGQLADDLDAWLQREAIAWTRPSPQRRAVLWSRRRPVRALACAAAALLLAASVAFWRFETVRERTRKDDAQALAVKTANAAVAAASERAKRQIEWFAGTVSAMRMSDAKDQLLPALVWVEWLGNSPVLPHQDGLPAAQERIQLLTTLVNASRTARGPLSLECLLAEYALSHLYLMQGDFVASDPYLSSVEEELIPRLGAADPLRVSVGAMRVCQSALRARADHQEADPWLTRLDHADTELASSNAADSTRRLVTKTIQTLAQHDP